MNIEVPVERLAVRSERLWREQVWFCIVVACALLAAARSTLPEIVLFGLSIPIIYSGYWKLGEKSGFLVAFVLAVVTVVPRFGQHDASAVGSAALEAAAYVLASAILAKIISRIGRYLVERPRAAGRDQLTRALTRAVFLGSCEQLIESSRKDKTLLLLMLADIDDLAAINTRFGRAAGDRALAAFAGEADRAFGRSGHFGRIGGDLFAFLARVDSSNHGERFALGLHAGLSYILAKPVGMVTCSMGAVLIAPNNRHSVVALIDIAAQHMDSAKRAGKNDVEFAWADFDVRRMVRASTMTQGRGAL